jgi:hypothetical protein
VCRQPTTEKITKENRTFSLFMLENSKVKISFTAQTSGTDDQQEMYCTVLKTAIK